MRERASQKGLMHDTNLVNTPVIRLKCNEQLRKRNASVNIQLLNLGHREKSIRKSNKGVLVERDILRTWHADSAMEEFLMEHGTWSTYGHRITIVLDRTLTTQAGTNEQRMGNKTNRFYYKRTMLEQGSYDRQRIKLWDHWDYKWITSKEIWENWGPIFAATCTQKDKKKQMHESFDSVSDSMRELQVHNQGSLCTIPCVHFVCT